MLTYTSQNWVHWDSTAARSAASPAGSPLSVPAVGLGLARTELAGAELCEGDAEAVDVAVDDEVAGSSVSMLTPEADVQPASRKQAMASGVVIAAGIRLNMNAPRDGAHTLSDCGCLERGRFITWGQRVNLITRGALEVQASEQGTTPSPDAPQLDPATLAPHRDR